MRFFKNGQFIFAQYHYISLKRPPLQISAAEGGGKFFSTKLKGKKFREKTPPSILKKVLEGGIFSGKDRDGRER